MVDKDMKYGHVRLHKLLALTYFEGTTNTGSHSLGIHLSLPTSTEGELDNARKHFLYADMPEEFGQLLVEIAENRGHPSEVDLFITQAVLQ